MIKSRLVTLTAAALLGLSVSAWANQDQAEVPPAAEAPVQIAPAAQPNFFNPGYWMNSFNGQQAPASTELTFNAAHPSSWMKFVNPQTHGPMHQQFVNPASYAQFMQPQFFMEFIKPENMMAWMDMNQYQAAMNPATMTWWMNPASHQHAMNPNMYSAAMNPASYLSLMNPANFTGWANAGNCDQENPQASGMFGYGCTAN